MKRASAADYRWPADMADYRTSQVLVAADREVDATAQPRLGIIASVPASTRT